MATPVVQAQQWRLPTCRLLHPPTPACCNKLRIRTHTPNRPSSAWARHRLVMTTSWAWEKERAFLISSMTLTDSPIWMIFYATESDLLDRRKRADLIQYVSLILESGKVHPELRDTWSTQWSTHFQPKGSLKNPGVTWVNISHSIKKVKIILRTTASVMHLMQGGSRSLSSITASGFSIMDLNPGWREKGNPSLFLHHLEIKLSVFPSKLGLFIPCFATLCSC